MSMKWFLTTCPLAIALSVGSIAPATADVYDSMLSDIGRRGSLSGSNQLTEERGGRSERRRIARATVSDDEDFDYRPRRRSRESERVHSRKVRAQQHVRRVQAARPDGRARSPRWTQRSLSAGGSTASAQSGVASYYWQGQRVASGGWFNPNAMTAAHKTLPFGTRVRVTHARSGRSVDVVINDRGPFIAGRIIDLSRAAASAIGMTAQGIAQVKMTVLGR
jgi:rare lipoprotein A